MDILERIIARARLKAKPERISWLELVALRAAGVPFQVKEVPRGSMWWRFKSLRAFRGCFFVYVGKDVGGETEATFDAEAANCAGHETAKGCADCTNPACVHAGMTRRCS